MLTDLKVDILLALSDNQGYSNSQLAERLNKKPSNISGPLGELEDDGLILKGEERKNKEDKRRSDYPYYLDKSKSIEIFQLVMENSLGIDKKLQDVLSNSDFINYTINNSDLLTFLNLFKDYSHNPQLIKIISKTLFANEALTNGYKKIVNKISKYPEDPSWFFGTRNAREFIEILQNFEPIDALCFYKKVINKSYSDLYGKIAARNGSNDDDLLRTFLEYDISLNPFTSFPVNDPIKLLFMKPFERIYEDVYFVDKSDYDIMVKRAYFIYSNFAKILVSGIASIKKQEESFRDFFTFAEPEEDRVIKKCLFLRILVSDLFCKREYLNSLIKEMIFYWNIASLRLDWLYYELININQISPAIKKYRYLSEWKDPLTDNPLIDINKNTFHPEISPGSLMLTALWCGETDPFMTLRYCNCFRDLGLEEKQIEIEEIASSVDESLNYQ
jgi:DNA-binding MarR family transcriptional regulator